MTQGPSASGMSLDVNLFPQDQKTAYFTTRQRESHLSQLRGPSRNDVLQWGRQLALECHVLWWTHPTDGKLGGHGRTGSHLEPRLSHWEILGGRPSLWVLHAGPRV